MTLPPATIAIVARTAEERPHLGVTAWWYNERTTQPYSPSCSSVRSQENVEETPEAPPPITAPPPVSQGMSRFRGAVYCPVIPCSKNEAVPYLWMGRFQKLVYDSAINLTKGESTMPHLGIGAVTQKTIGAASFVGILALSLTAVAVLGGGAGGCGGGAAGGGGGTGTMQTAAGSAALSSVQSALQTSITNLSGQGGLVLKGEESSEEVFDDECEVEGSFVEEPEGSGIFTSGTITTTCPCEDGEGTVVFTETVGEDPNTFQYTTQYANCRVTACGETVVLNGSFSMEAVYDTSLTVTIATAGGCETGGITATGSDDSETEVGMDFQVTLNDISLPECEDVEEGEPCLQVTISGQAGVAGACDTIDSFEDLEDAECLDGVIEDECTELCADDADPENCDACCRGDDACEGASDDCGAAYGTCVEGCEDSDCLEDCSTNESVLATCGDEGDDDETEDL